MAGMPSASRLPVSPDPVATRLRRVRIARGLSLGALARAARGFLEIEPRDARPRSVSVSYLSLIENGRKVPDEPIAVAIARALDDDPALYRSWVRARKRNTDLHAAIQAAETLKRLLALPPPAAEARREREVLTRLRVPVLPAGLDPGDSLRPACEIEEWRRFDPEAIPEEPRGRIARPFAYRLTRELVRRVPHLLDQGTHALVLRAWLPLGAEPVYAVRSAGRVELSRVLWNGRRLLLLPAPDAHDFEVIDATDQAQLGWLVLGRAMAVRFDSEERSP